MRENCLLFADGTESMGASAGGISATARPKCSTCCRGAYVQGHDTACAEDHVQDGAWGWCSEGERSERSS